MVFDREGISSSQKNERNFAKSNQLKVRGPDAGAKSRFSVSERVFAIDEESKNTRFLFISISSQFSVMFLILGLNRA